VTAQPVGLGIDHAAVAMRDEGASVMVPAGLRIARKKDRSGIFEEGVGRRASSVAVANHESAGWDSTSLAGRDADRQSQSGWSNGANTRYLLDIEKRPLRGGDHATNLAQRERDPS
jgi:hypothetical protein